MFSGVFVSAFFGVLNGVLVHFESQETDHAFVAAVLGFELFDDVALTRELHEVIEAGGLFLNRVGELAQAPILFADDLTAVFGDNTAEFAHSLFDLYIGQNRRGNENGLVMVHNANFKSVL